VIWPRPGVGPRIGPAYALWLGRVSLLACHIHGKSSSTYLCFAGETVQLQTLKVRLSFSGEGIFA
jgi:hypothetical protein